MSELSMSRPARDTVEALLDDSDSDEDARYPRSDSQQAEGISLEDLLQEDSDEGQTNCVLPVADKRYATHV